MIEKKNKEQNLKDSVDLENNSQEQPECPLSDATLNIKKAESTSHSAKIDRVARFKQLQRRKIESLAANKKELHFEYKRNRTDTKAQQAFERKKDEAQFELDRIEAEENGEDFERKRAWDWTVEESEKWDEKMSEKKRREKETEDGFKSYGDMAVKAYEKSLKKVDVDLEGYQKQMERMRKNGIDVDDSFSGGLSSKPTKHAVDKLVDKLTEGDKERMKRRKKDDDNKNVSYINDKNKQFNEKLGRHYDKYTKEIRDSFERGTAI
ncbi:SYF2-domain-containing protein [Nadsonia fulvescens var. elongata DSM 6958]|uniref:Pre-mRNA-splicing factor SYF2 n=1 Tax=Nadsonia fulvescens var. elongata DSM 6958 TaxID=857566 RepID=A0A1E3PT56_9ASCO|nr:SYF2-domain-containing protein [Nadsonia fulvescens var. elongata DSM 6958]